MFTLGDPDSPVLRPQTHELVTFVDEVSDMLAAEYERIRRRVRDDPGTAGDEGEENWRDLFQQWLPPELQVVTKGRILGHRGTLSPQVDVIVLRPGYPRSLRNKKTYLAGGVLAAFECKLTLRPAHVRAAALTARAIRQLAGPRSGSPYEELHSPIIFGLLAHATAIRRHPADQIDALLQKVLAADDHPRDALDVLCVAALTTWSRHTILLPRQTGTPEEWDALRSIHELAEDGGVRSFYMRWIEWPGNATAPRPLYTLFEQLVQRSAWEIPLYRPMAEYWTLTGGAGAGSVAARSWPFSILSESVVSAIKRGRLSNGPRWTPWGMFY